MFFKFIYKFLKKIFTKIYIYSDSEAATTLEKATRLMLLGDRHSAIKEFKAYLQFDPYNIQALNDLGVCLADIGNIKESTTTFELAYSLDDTYIPVVVNHAKLLNDLRRSSDALPFLRQAKISAPEFAHVDAVYGGLCLTTGYVVKARHFQRKAWLANFDNLRLANCHLFYASYDDIDEIQIASEHRFWAETVRPLEISKEALNISESESINDNSSVQKIRIGYWSPDFRNHSVRYFFRPLLENHDLNNFDIYLYHDFPIEDTQTKLMQAACTHFYDVYELSDVDMFKLVKSHQLDIFVELAGHSSHNRVTLLQQRFANIQISALGYPPTTGLTTIDAKLLDSHVVTPDSNRYYTESPLILPNSFWCFDPMEDAPISQEPPVVRNGYITFGCIGNTAKINLRILRCWRMIAEQIPSCRLVIRSINFEDSAAEDGMRKCLVGAGISLDRVDLRRPEGGSAFFDSYNQIDIVLDTFPFNGGTTTCFATYMGVPVVSLVGHSLLGRMGLSILSNLGIPELAVSNETAYIEQAVMLAKNVPFLQTFRRNARALFQKSSLGCGKLFAGEFEQACKTLLAKKETNTFSYQHDIPPLPAAEIMRRAYSVYRSGQTDAAQRILNHCLKHYPDNGSAHLLVAQKYVEEHHYQDAVNYLLVRLENFDPTEKISALITIVRWYLLLDKKDDAIKIIEKLSHIPLIDKFDQLQVEIYSVCCNTKIATVSNKAHVQKNFKRFHVLIPCNSSTHFDAICKQFDCCCKYPDEWIVTYERCDEANRTTTYETVIKQTKSDILVIAQKNITIHNPQFFLMIAETLDHCDIVGFAGASRWSRMDWRFDEFEFKSAGFLIPSSEQKDGIEIQILGSKPGTTTYDIAVLDGSLLAFNTKILDHVKFDPELEGAEILLEEDCTHTAYKSGLRLAVHRNLGILLNQNITLDSKYRSAGRLQLAKKLDFDPFEILYNDHMILSAPTSCISDANHVLHNFLGTSI